MKECYKIALGTCIFTVNAPDDMCIEVHPNFLPYCVTDNLRSHINIDLQIGLPTFDKELKQLTNARNLPEFYNHELKYHYYTLKRSKDQFIIFSGEEGEGEWSRIAVTDFSFSNWKIYLSEKALTEKINPLSFPLGPLIFYYGITVNQGVFLHASGIIHENDGMIFSGFSGIGKTTISNIWLSNGSELINDDRLLLMRGDDGFNMYNSPMSYHQEAKSAKISSVFLLKQANENNARKLSKAAALARVLALCIQHDHDKLLVDNLVRNVHHLINAVPVYELAFKPDNSIVEYVKGIL